jgi:hypothetical protein
MRVATTLVVVMVIILAISAAPRSGAAHDLIVFSFGGAHVAQDHAEARVQRAR